mgnify:CR=1 FL=1
MPEGNKSRASGVGVETALWTPARCQHHLVVFLHIPVGQVLSFIDVDNLYPAPGVHRSIRCLKSGPSSLTESPRIFNPLFRRDSGSER